MNKKEYLNYKYHYDFDKPNKDLMIQIKRSLRRKNKQKFLMDIKNDKMD